MADSSSSKESPSVCTSKIREQAEFETSVIKKLNWRVSPFCGLITILAYIDRGNLGFAAGKICNELDLSHKEYGIGASLFFVGYLFSQVPSNILLKRFGPNRWLAFLLIAWGITASSLAFVQNRTQFYVLRFVLGLAEGGGFPGVWYYLTLFFPNMYIAAPFALIAASVQLASPASAPLAAGLLALDGHLGGVDGWRLLFFVEGVIPVIYGALLPWILPSSLDKASFLDDEEKSWLESKLEENQQAISVTVIEQFKIIFNNFDFWKLTGYHFFRYMVLNTGVYWTTLIIDDMLYGDEEDDDDDTCASSKSTGAVAVVLTTIPFTVTAALCLVMGNAAPRIKNKTLISAAVVSAGSVFWATWVLSRNNAFVVALMSLVFALASANMMEPLVLGVFTSHFESEIKAAAIASLNTLANFGNIIGLIVIGFLVDDYGYGAAAGLLAAVCIIKGVLLFHVNDPLHGKSTDEGRMYERVENQE